MKQPLPPLGAALQTKAPLEVSKEGEGVTIKGFGSEALVVEPGLEACNGVIHKVRYSAQICSENVRKLSAARIHIT